MSDETKKFSEAGSVFTITLSVDLPEYVFEVTSSERLPNGNLRLHAIRRERRPDDVPNATLMRPNDESDSAE